MKQEVSGFSREDVLACAREVDRFIQQLGGGPGLWPGYRSARSLFREGLNPYLHCVRESGCEVEQPEAVQAILQGTFSVNSHLRNMIHSAVHRERFISDFSFAIPNKEALDLLVSFGPIVEMGAGNGYWGWCLKQLGCPVRLYDNFSWSIPWTTWWKRPRRAGPSILRKYGPGWTLFLCWPCASYAADSLRHFRGHRVAYIGESCPGLCADRAFFDLLDESGYQMVKAVTLPHWEGLRDNLFIYEKSDG